MSVIPVVMANSISENEARGFEVEGQEIVFMRVDGEIRAFAGMCTHERLPLDGGDIEDGVLTCCWHGARFDARTGQALALPAVKKLQQYDTRIGEDGRVYVTLPD